MSMDNIEVRGAEEHNLEDIDVTIPREAFTVVTGLSGSGKSSLAFETIYAEGQRRYIESLSAYARNFLGQMDKPQVETVEGLSPAISIDQKKRREQPALDGRDRHGIARLSPSSLRPCRHPPLSRVWPRSRRAKRPEHGRAHPRVARRNAGQTRRAGRPRPERSLRGPVRRTSIRGILPRRNRRRGVRPHT